MPIYQKQPRSLKQRSLEWAGCGLPLHLVLWVAMCLFEIAIFEVDVEAIKAQGRHMHYQKKENSQLPELILQSALIWKLYLSYFVQKTEGSSGEKQDQNQRVDL